MRQTWEAGNTPEENMARASLMKKADLKLMLRTGLFSSTEVHAWVGAYLYWPILLTDRKSHPAESLIMPLW